MTGPTDTSLNPFGNCHKCANYAKGQGTKACLKCKQLRLFDKTWEDRDTIRVVHIPSAIMEAVGDGSGEPKGIAWAIQKLAPNEAACLLMQYYGKCTREEMADVLCVSTRTIDNILRKARAGLKYILTKDNQVVE